MTRDLLGCRWRYALLALCLLMPVAARAADKASAGLICSSGENTDLARGQVRADEVGNEPMFVAIRRVNGAPASCNVAFGSVTDPETSVVEFAWPNGARYTIQTMKPETLIVTYARSAGILAPQTTLKHLRDYAARIGLRIDWSRPEIEGAEQVFSDADPTLNGFARIRYRGKRIIGFSLSLAL